MSPSRNPDERLSASPEPDGDAWAAFGYIGAGVLFYGLIGFGLSVWLHAGYWIPIGILVGAGFGMFMVFARYRVRPTEPFPADHGLGAEGSNTSTESDVSVTAPIDEAARATRPASDDRGETA
jgi:ATP synthase protein I